MGKKRKWFLYSLLCIIIVVSSFYGKTWVTGITLWASELEGAEGAKSSLEEKKKEMEKKIADLEKEKDNIMVYIEKLDQQFLELTDEIMEIENNMDAVEAKIAENQVSLEYAKEAEASQYVMMKTSIKYMYENGNYDYFEILSESKNITDFLNRTEYITKISRYNKETLGRYRLAKEEVEEKESNLLLELQELNRLEQELLFEQQTLEMLIEDKRTELVKYDDKIGDSSLMATKFQEEIEQQELLIEELLEQERKRVEEEEMNTTPTPIFSPSTLPTNEPTTEPLSTPIILPSAEPTTEASTEPTTEPSSTPTILPSAEPTAEPTTEPTTEPTSSPIPEDKPNGSVQFIWPLPISGVITSYFGDRDAPTEGASSNHKGIDIGVASGTSIMAAADGKVVTSTYQAAAGNYIMIYHGNSTYTVYMHCSKLIATVNQEVKQGDVIAYVGSTGVSTGPHLHFGVSINGTYVNPLNYLNK